MLRLERVRLRQAGFSLSASFEVAEGSVTAVIGPSGAGKSTLLAAIAGFLAPVAGRVWIGGRDVTEAAPAERPISMLFQDNNLFAHLSVAENVGLGLAPRLRLTPAEREAVHAVLAEVGLAGMEDRKPGALSGGQQSRVALARVLIAQRALVLLDEPFSALGPGLRDEMLDLAVAALGRAGRTLMMVTHEPQDAQRVAGQVIFVDGGVAHPPEATEAVFAHPSEALTRYLGQSRG